MRPTALSPFQHVVLTRFNTRIPGKPPASDDWLRARLDLMKETLLPAMSGQTVSPDRWLVLCDAGSPDWFKCEVTDDLRGVGEPVWVEDGFDPSIVQPYASSPWLITTRVDNDDCVSTEYIRRIQNQFDFTRKFINFPYGLQYERGWTYHRVDMSNAFISLVERSDSPIATVFIDGHHLLKRHGKLKQVWAPPMWMQIVHGGNVANVVRGVRSHSGHAKEFPTLLPINKVSPILTFLLALKDTLALALHIASKPERLFKLGKIILGKAN